MKNTLKNTARPWFVSRDKNIILTHNKEICGMASYKNGHDKEMDGNAELIVKAVNMHEELITVLEECYSTINQLGFLSGDKLYTHNLNKIDDVLRKARE